MLDTSDDCLVQVSSIIVGKITDANIHFDRNLVEVALRQYLVNILRSRKYKSDKRNSKDPTITEEWKQKRKDQNIKYNKKRAKESIVSKMDSKEQETVEALSVEPVATKEEKAISGTGRLQAIKERAEKEGS